MKRETVTSCIVCDGFERWEAGVKAGLRAEVTAEFAERLRDVSTFRRFLLRLDIEEEVERRFRDVTPPSDEALF